jgi:Uma2 family endonuclease
MSSASSHTPLPHLATFADLLAIPEDERFHEILDGEIVQKAMASGDHGLSQAEITAWLLTRWGRRPNGADAPGGWWFVTECEVELSRHQVARPDIAGWRRERMPDRPRGYPLRLRPDWVCEVMTDGDARRRDGLKKRRLYADYGVPHYWLVDTERERLSVLRLEAQGFVEVLEAGRGDRVRAEPFEALELPVGVLFGDDE